MAKNFDAQKGPVVIGSGYLYAIEAEDFSGVLGTDGKTPDTTQMVEIGYISGSGTFNTTSEMKEIPSANYGTVVRYKYNQKTDFDTDIISYIPENVALFMTGSETEETEDGIITYFCEDDQSPDIALVFDYTDARTGKKGMKIMPKANWVGDLTLDFNNDNPVALDFHFSAVSTELPNGKIGTIYSIDPKTGEIEEEDEEEPAGNG